MILVTLGTQTQKMYRLLDKIEKSNIDDEIIVQAGGSSDYKSKKMKIFKWLGTIVGFAIIALIIALVMSYIIL